MNKQELLEKIKALKPDEQCLHEYQPEEWEAFQDGFDDGKCYVELIIEQLDEPEKPKQMQPKTLGRRLRRLRKINGETQKEFAENFSRHYRTVQNWELDRSVPDVFTALALAEYYNMSVEELVDGEDDYDKEL